MLKKSTAIVFIILANILVLAHAVVPHHHHHKQVCLINSHCINDNVADEQNTNRDNHSHDGEKNSDDCILKEPVIVFTDQWKIDFKFNPKTSEQTGHNQFYINQSKPGTKFLFPVFLGHIPSYLNTSSYSSLVSASLGLRAPPVV